MRAALLVVLAACGVPPGPIDAPAYPPQLVARYPLDHLQDGVINDVANGHDAMCTTCATLEPGQVLLALHFTSTDQRFTAAPAADLDDISRGISVAAWLSPDASAGAGCALAKGTSWSLCLTATRQPQFAGVTAAVELPVGEWHHIAGVSDGTVVCLYVDGREVALRTQPMTGDTTGLVIGAGYTGFLDEPHIYSGVLGPAEVAAVMINP